jgi:hypothetical protein
MQFRNQTGDRGALHIVADAIAVAIWRGVERVTQPKTDRTFQAVTSLLPAVQSLIHMLKPPVPVDLDGPRVKQLRRELAAHEARLHAKYTERRAWLVADFGPRFDEAHAADSAAAAMGAATVAAQ